ncbi:3-dehydroquinate synthase II [Chitinophaga sp. 212800010-3]|uniref:3-dehydroquinate synthase II n=1 Tax=unclassified Chitinophaga TaxID=2619133 RepID=UPI002DEF27FF|nr:3-dehydroquinate synthase [Chitinophaga sp. 212800010-3]
MSGKKNGKEKIVWVDGRDLAANTEILLLVYHLNFTCILIRRRDLDKFKAPKRMNFVIEIEKKEDLKELPAQCIVFSSSSELLNLAAKAGHKTAVLCKIEDEASMNFAWKEGMNYDYLIAEFTSATNIPLELLIAKLQPTNTVLIKKIYSVQEADVVFGVMEAGSDGVLFTSEIVSDFVKLDQLLQKQSVGKLKLVKALVTSVQHAGMGFRACVDTTSLLRQNEGMLIGSTSDGGLLVSSETHYLPYMDLRPFRVNAGAVHSYIWCPDSKTAYITELKGGSRVTCVDTEGNTREVVVGRVKTEVRPLLKIEVMAENRLINAFVQDDWHIRIFGGKGEPLNASCIKEGDELLAYICERGRHVGIKIDESIEEK